MVSKQVKTNMQNEKYVGDAYHITINKFKKTVKENNEIAESIYIKNSHPAIILREDFDNAKKMLNK